MNITVSRKSLSQVQQMAAVANNRSPLPILANFLIEATGQDISIIATGMEVGSKLTISAATAVGSESVDATIEEPGSICINAAKFAEIMRLFDDTSMIVIKGNEKSVQISDFNKKTSYKFPTLDPSDFPAFASFDDVEWKEQSTGEMIKHMFRCMYAASTDTTRFNLNALCYAPYGDGYCLVATDGHRLALQKLDEYPFGSSGELRAALLLSRSSAEFIKKTLIGSKQSKCQIATDQKNLLISVGNMLISCRLIDGEFPDFNKVIADISTASKVTVNKDEFMSAVKRASLVTMDRARGISIAISNNNNAVLSANTEIGSSEEVITISYDGNPFDVIMNSDYLTDSLTALDGKQINIYYVAEGKPITIENDESTDYFNIVMPMRNSHR